MIGRRQRRLAPHRDEEAVPAPVEADAQDLSVTPGCDRLACGDVHAYLGFRGHDVPDAESAPACINLEVHRPRTVRRRLFLHKSVSI